MVLVAAVLWGTPQTHLTPCIQTFCMGGIKGTLPPAPELAPIPQIGRIHDEVYHLQIYLPFRQKSLKLVPLAAMF